MNTMQLEIRFEPGPGIEAVNRGKQRFSRARWWFKQMHRVVDGARERNPAAPRRPKPTPLDLIRDRCRQTR